MVPRATRPTTRERVGRVVDLAHAAERRIDRFFWLLVLADVLNLETSGDPRPSSARPLVVSSRPIACATVVASTPSASRPQRSCLSTDLTVRWEATPGVPAP